MAKKKLQQIQQLPANTILGNNTGSVDEIKALTVAEVNTLLGTGSGDLTYIGEYNASTNSPDLDTSPSNILKGHIYEVSTSGDFFTETLPVRAVLIAKQDDPTTIDHWMRLNPSMELIDVQGLTSGAQTELETGTFDANEVYTGSNTELTNSEDGVEHIGDEYYFKKYSGSWHRMKKKSDVAATPTPLNKSIVIVTNNTYTATDDVLKTQLESFGFDVDFLADTADAPATGVYDLAIITEPAGSGSVSTKYNLVDYGVLLFDGALWDDALVNAGSGGTHFTGDGYVMNSTHPIMSDAGLVIGTTNFQTGTNRQHEYATSVGGDSTDLVEATSSSGNIILSVYDKGELLHDGTTQTPARRAFWGIEDFSHFLSEDGLSLLESLCKWLTEYIDPAAFDVTANSVSFFFDMEDQTGWVDNSGRANSVTDISGNNVVFTTINSGMGLGVNYIARETGDQAVGNVYEFPAISDPTTGDFTISFVMSATQWTQTDYIIEDSNGNNIWPVLAGLDINLNWAGAGTFSFSSGNNPINTKLGFILQRTGTTLSCKRRIARGVWEDATATITSYNGDVQPNNFRGGDDGSRFYMLGMFNTYLTGATLFEFQELVDDYIDSSINSISKRYWFIPDTTTMFDAESGGSALGGAGEDVLRWEDQSGNGLHLVNTEGADITFDEFVSNQGFVLFDSGSALESATAGLSSTTTSFTIFIVASADNPSISWPWLWSDNATNSSDAWASGVGFTTLDGTTNLGLWVNDYDDGTSWPSTTLDTADNIKIYELSWNGQTLEIKVDNVSQGTLAFSGSITNGSLGISLGGGSIGFVDFWAGRVFEVICLESYDATQSDNIYKYLRDLNGV